MSHFPHRPWVSFVLATYNRGATLLDCLARTLAAARESLGESRFDLHIVDNASTDETPGLLAGFARQHRQVIVHGLAKNCGPVAKNVALHQNPADLIVLLDDDAYPLPGSLPQMVRHFQDDPHLGAAVFDVTLPDGRKEASAYPDVFIGAGTALRGKALRSLKSTRPGGGLLPADFFMQAEEYDLSFRLLAAGYSVQRFWDMPLMHLKAPGARIGHRTTRLDVRNNLWLLARYVPEPLAAQLAADWLARYFRMAIARDREAGGSRHRAAFLRGSAEGLTRWGENRGPGDLLLDCPTLERLFRFEAIRQRLARACHYHGIRRIALGDWGKNILPFFQGARDLALDVTAIVDNNLAATGNEAGVDYRGIPVVSEAQFAHTHASACDAIVLTTLARPHAERRSAHLRRAFPALPVLDLFSILSPIPRGEPRAELAVGH